MHSSEQNNYMVGAHLEQSVKTILKKDRFSVKPHRINQSGLDVEGEGKDRLIAIECLNWWGGFLHGERFKAIVKNLVSFPGERYLICCGIKPNGEQYRLFKAYDVRVVHYPKQISKPELAFERLIRRELRLGCCITSIHYPMDLISESPFFSTSRGFLVLIGRNQGFRFKLDSRIWHFSLVLYVPEKRSMKDAPLRDGPVSLTVNGGSSSRSGSPPSLSLGKASPGD